MRKRTYREGKAEYRGFVKCAKCEGGARGLVGHFDLYVLRLDSQMMQFKCATCGTLWSRSAKSEAAVVWTNSTAEMKGLPVPGWKARGPIES